MQKQATTIITPNGKTVRAGLLIAAPATLVSVHPIAGGSWLSLRPRGA